MSDKIPYKENDLLKIAMRYNNPRRKYLLVNPLQAKHIPVSPSKAYNMMALLGDKIFNKYGNGRVLVVAFAETATAVGSIVADRLNDDASYIHTTREVLTSKDLFYSFVEEHSHATNQNLFAPGIEKLASDADTVIFVDDEITTGKTILNIVNVLKQESQCLCNKNIIAASITNSMLAEDFDRFYSEGIVTECLLRIEKKNYDDEIALIGAHAPKDYFSYVDYNNKIYRIRHVCIKGRIDPRNGMSMSSYRTACTEFAEEIVKVFGENVGNKVLVLGTEEFMFPAIWAGLLIEQHYAGVSVRCHATTRSPIKTSYAYGYPINEGYRIKSMYNSERSTYIYNLEYYDNVIIMTDAESPSNEATRSLLDVIAVHGAKSILCVRWVD